MLCVFNSKLEPSQNGGSGENAPPSTEHAPPRRFGFQADFDTYPLEWSTLEDFEAWRRKEEASHCIDFGIHDTSFPKERSGTNALDPPFVWRREWSCGRQGTGAKGKEYVKKHPERKQKVGTKRLEGGCPCRLVIKAYPDTPRILGKYKAEHSHTVGEDNVRYTRIPSHITDLITQMLRNKIDPEHILKVIHEGAFADPSDLKNRTVTRTDFVTRANVRAIEVAIEAETVRLARDDGESVRRWVQNLQASGSLLAFKGCNDPAPEGSEIPTDTFFLAIQTPWQREIHEEVAEYVLCIDGTHNTTQYYNCNLYTILGRDKWGHGIPLAWLIASNGKEETLRYYLELYLAQKIKLPKWFMSDKDMAQLNAIIAVYTAVLVLLCWWHVLHAWQQHFNPKDFPELWDLLKKWIRMTDKEEFLAAREKIRTLAPNSFDDYLEKNWMNCVEKWSAVYRVDRYILERIDTNMLIEAWHHVLKSKFMCGKRNRRLDQLLHILINEVLPFYAHKHLRQKHGFEGLNLEMRERRDVQERAASIAREHVQILANDTTRFQVQSQSDKNRIYEVDIAAFSCSCAYYPTLRYCKHIAAVQLTFPSLTSPIEEATTASGNSRQSLAQLSTPEPSDLPAMNTTMPPEASCPTSGDSHSSATWDRIKIKFHSILSAASTTSSTFLALPATNDVIIKLEGCLDQLSTLASHNATPGTLPPTQRVPPHILCKTETQNTLPRAKDSKNARKRNTDPFSAGERPGKLAKMDAKGPAAAEAVKAREKLPLTSLLQSGSEPSVDSHFDANARGCHYRHTSPNLNLQAGDNTPNSVR